jgi:hypothetical protein
MASENTPPREADPRARRRRVIPDDAATVSQEFRHLARDVDSAQDLLSVALALDRAFHPDLDLEAYRGRIEEIGRRFRREIASVADAPARFNHLGRFLGDRLGFCGPFTAGER